MVVFVVVSIVRPFSTTIVELQLDVPPWVAGKCIESAVLLAYFSNDQETYVCYGQCPCSARVRFVRVCTKGVPLDIVDMIVLSSPHNRPDLRCQVGGASVVKRL